METHLVMIHDYSKDELTKNRISQLLKTKGDNEQCGKQPNGMICDLCLVKFQ